MNSVPWYEIKRQVEYKAAWKGFQFFSYPEVTPMGTSNPVLNAGETPRRQESSKDALVSQVSKMDE